MAKKDQDAPKVQRFDQIQHKEASKLKSSGIRTLLGKRDYGDLEVGLRSYLAPAVMNRKEAVEAKIRREKRIVATDLLVGEDAVEVSTETMLMAITGACGELVSAPEVVEAAKAAGIEVIEDNVVVLKWEDDSKATFKVFQAMIDPDMLITLTLASKAIASLSDKEVVELGKDSTYGLASDLDWQD